MRSARKTAAPRSRWSVDGKISESGINQVYFELQAYFQPNERAKGKDRAHPDDVRAVLARAYAMLERDRHLPNGLRRFLRVGLGRFLSKNLSLDQAFGLKKSRRGHPGVPEARKRAIAVAVLEAYIKGGTLDAAAMTAGHKHGIAKTRALEFFRECDGYALDSLKFQRLQKSPSRPWNAQEERRLNKYYARRNRLLVPFFKNPPDNSG
jgi:hypothetical protein